ncbi:hypothetical protein IE994_16515 [Enterobacter hormaechei]|nr:hypothetical protein [Enterobacter hormaechei]
MTTVTLRAWVKAGKFPQPTRLSARTLRWSRSQLTSFLNPEGGGPVKQITLTTSPDLSNIMHGFARGGACLPELHPDAPAGYREQYEAAVDVCAHYALKPFEPIAITSPAHCVAFSALLVNLSALLRAIGGAASVEQEMRELIAYIHLALLPAGGHA